MARERGARRVSHVRRRTMARRTAPPLRMPPPQVLWWRAGGGGSEPPPPLVAVVAWMQAQPRHVAAYAALYRRLGAEVCAVLPPVLHMWLEWRALALATCLADALSAELEAHGARPVLLASFSGGPKACTSKLLQARFAFWRCRALRAG